jgi:Gpi18-like mannosyltransferase
MASWKTYWDSLRRLGQNRTNTDILFIGLMSRFIVFFSAIIGYYTIGVRERLPNDVMWDIGLPVVQLFNRWDSGHYINIALNWYSIGPQGPSEAWAFFPLYPALMRIVGTPIMGFMSPSQAVALGGFLISNSLFFVAIFCFYKLSDAVLKNRDLALLSTIAFSLWPGSLFYSCVYTESLFMTLMVAALYLLEKNKMLPAVILGFLVGWARPNGFLIFIPFLYKAIEKRDKLLICESAVFFLPYFLFNLYGFLVTNIFPIREWVYAEYWRSPTTTVFTQLFDYPVPVGVSKTGYALLAFIELVFLIIPAIHLLFSKSRLVATLSLELKMKHDEAKYYALTIAFLVSTLFYGGIQNLHRYGITLLPLYWLLAKISRRGIITRTAIFSIIATMLVIGTMLFATWRYYL